MITEFGKELRKMRIDNNELLGDMAKNLKMTASYLSAIEIGKRPIPNDFLEKMKEVYSLTPIQEKSLEQQIELQAKLVKIDLEDATTDLRSLACSFARRFNSLSDEDIKKLSNILGKTNAK